MEFPENGAAGPDAPGTVFEQAVALHGQGHTVDAEYLYRILLRTDPAHFDALHNLGVLLTQSGRPREAGELLCRALDVNPCSPEAQYHLGVLLQSTGCHAEAIAQHEAAIGALADYPEAYFALGTALQAVDRSEDAIAAYERAIGLDAGYAEAHYNLGVALQSSDLHGDAIAHFEKALDIDPNYAEARLGLDVALLAMGRRSETSSYLASADSLKPRLAKATESRRTFPENQAIRVTSRLNQYVGSFLNNHNNPRMGMYPGLTSRPWHDPAGVPLVRALEGAYDEIVREIAALEDASYHSEIEQMTVSGAWDVFLFYERGKKNVENCERCPTISEIIENHNTVRTMAGLMYVSKMRPGTQVRPHRGPTNMRLRCHLGVTVPEGDCGIRIGGEARSWSEGKCIVFDDSFEHEAWNRTNRDRIVLIIDVWHPDLTAREVSFLEGLHRYGAFHAHSLMRYWNENNVAKG